MFQTENHKQTYGEIFAEYENRNIQPLRPEEMREAKFDELDRGVWIWDNKEKEFIPVLKTLSPDECQYLYHNKNKKVFLSWHAYEFKKNRFYFKKDETNKTLPNK